MIINIYMAGKYNSIVPKYTVYLNMIKHKIKYRIYIHNAATFTASSLNEV